MSYNVIRINRDVKFLSRTSFRGNFGNLGIVSHRALGGRREGIFSHRDAEDTEVLKLSYFKSIEEIMKTFK